jgi:small subunit ribosomal protein S16
MLAIRLNRTGKRNRAHFRVVVQEHTKAPGKRHVEIVGSYDPHKKTTILKKERILYWISQGAQVSDAVHNMLVREGVVEAKKIAKKMPRPVVKEVPEEVKADEAPVATEVAPAVDVVETPSAPEVVTKAEAVAPEAPKTEEIVTDGVFAGTASKEGVPKA